MPDLRVSAMKKVRFGRFGEIMSELKFGLENPEKKKKKNTLKE